MSNPMLVELARQVGEGLRRKNWTLATAESCTGGLLGHLLTEVPGSSAYYLGGIIAYTNRLKQELLDVPVRLLEEHGAVSEAVARAMAEGAWRRLGAAVALSITGIAGPGGGTPEKPVGLVYLGLATPEGAHVERWVWDGDRMSNKLRSAQRALELLIEMG